MRAKLGYMFKFRMLYVLSIPGIVYFLIFKYVPLLGSVIAFQNYNLFAGFTGSPWVGWQHFEKMFAHYDFIRILHNTIVLGLMDLLIAFPTPIILALLLNEVRRTFFKRTVQTIMYAPHFLSWVIISGIFIGILSPTSGFVNQILGWFGIEPIYFLVEQAWIRPVLVGSGIWRDAGYGTIVYLAALTSVNPELYEAAEVDGANRWKQTWSITIPSILPVMTVLFLLTIGDFLDFGFERVFVFQNSLNLGSSEFLDTFIYKAGLKQMQFSYATAMGLFKSVVGLMLLVIANTLSRGWWDFRFDELMFRHDYRAPEVVPPANIEPVKWFRDIGWVAMHHRMETPEEHMMLLMKSSKYGSISHSHGDQNAFLLHAYGEPLAIESGYYVAFGSTMHMNWRRQTKSKNALLIDGKGQYAGRDKAISLEASGKVEEAWEREGIGYVRSDATAAYRVNLPYVTRCVREIYFIHRSYFVVVDSVDLEQPGRVSWLFHALYEMKLSRQSFRLSGKKAELIGQVVYCSSGEMELAQHNRFDDVDPAEMEGLPVHWHLSAETPPAKSHRIAVLLVPMKKTEPKLVNFFLDDQDHGVHLYVTEHGVTKRIEILKAY